jgi:MFS family permease
MDNQNQNIANRNIKVNLAADAVGSLIFSIPVWVAYELRYITIAQLPIVEAVIQGTQTILELPTGALADLWGKKATVLTGYFLATCGAVFYAFSRSFHAFLVFALITGIGQAFVSGAREAMAYDSLKAANRENEFSKFMSKSSLIFQIGLALATLTGGFLGTIDIIIPIWLSSLSTFGMFIAFLFSREPLIDTAKFTLENYVRQTKMGFHELFKSKYIRDLSLFYIGVGGITWAAMMLFNAALLTDTGYQPAEFGITVSTIRVINSLILFGALQVNRVFTKKTTFLTVAGVMLFSYLPGIFLTKPLAALAVAGSTFSSTFRWIVLGKLVNAQYESRNRATALSTLSMSVAFLVVFLMLISGPIMASLGGVKAMYSLLGIFTLIGILPLAIRLTRRSAHL